MSPYEVRLLIEIDVGLWPLTIKDTLLLSNTVYDFFRRLFAKAKRDRSKIVLFVPKKSSNLD